MYTQICYTLAMLNRFLTKLGDYMLKIQNEVAHFHWWMLQFAYPL